MNDSVYLLTRTITDLDEVRLMNLLRRQFGATPPPLAQSLLAVLDHADVVAPQAIGADVVTMGSRIALQLASGETRELSVVYPEDANADEARMSILSPIGAALLGAHVGDAVSWQGTGGGATQAHIQAVLFQPEASGDFTA